MTFNWVHFLVHFLEMFSLFRDIKFYFRLFQWIVCFIHRVDLVLELLFISSMNCSIKGFNMKSIGCSATSIVIACEGGKLIAWGASPCYGELGSKQIYSHSIWLIWTSLNVSLCLHVQGIGDSPKSSSQPTFVEYMDGVNVSQVTMGLEHTLLLVNIDNNVSDQQNHLTRPEHKPTDGGTTTKWVCPSVHASIQSSSHTSFWIPFFYFFFIFSNSS